MLYLNLGYPSIHTSHQGYLYFMLPEKYREHVEVLLERVDYITYYVTHKRCINDSIFVTNYQYLGT